MKTFAIAGCGHLGKIVQEAYTKGLLEGYQLIAAYSRKIEDAEKLVSGTDAKAASSMDEVIALKPDFIIETASIALLKDFAIEALEKEFSSFEKQRIELCKAYANKDSDGNPVIKDEAYDVPDDVKEEFRKELADLSDEEIDIDIRTVSAEEFEKCEQADRYDIPTGEDFAILGFMIDG